MFQPFFIFHRKFYEQCDDASMSSPLRLKVPNVLLMIHFYNFDQRTMLINLVIISINEKEPLNKRTIEGNLTHCKLKVIFRSKCRLNTLLCFKDSLEKKICSGIIYYTCSNSKATDFGKSFRHIYTRASKHIEISNLSETRLKIFKHSATSYHLLQCNCTINFNDFDILVADSNKFKSLLTESLLITRDKPIFNKTL